MSAWLIGLTVYWIGCFLFLIASMALCHEHDARWELLKAVARKKLWLVVVCVSISLLFIAAIAPVATPYWLVQCHLQARRERAYWTSLLRTHREFIFDPIHPVNLPDQTRDYFDSGGEALRGLGFAPLGSYRMKEVPANYFGRCFLSGDGTVVCALIDIFGEQDYGFSTMFEDGRMLETSSSECTEGTQWLLANERYRAVYVTNEPIEAGWRKHQEAVAAAVDREGVRPLAVERDAVLDFIQYEGRLFSQILFERGELDEPPPEPEMPRHCARHAGAARDKTAPWDPRSASSANDLELAVR
jgi:hypothetical protein